MYLLPALTLGKARASPALSRHPYGWPKLRERGLKRRGRGSRGLLHFGVDAVEVFEEFSPFVVGADAGFGCDGEAGDDGGGAGGGVEEAEALVEGGVGGQLGEGVVEDDAQDGDFLVDAGDGVFFELGDEFGGEVGGVEVKHEGGRGSPRIGREEIYPRMNTNKR